MHSTPLFQTTTLKTEHTALWTRAFWGHLTNVRGKVSMIPSPLPCLSTWPNSHLWEPAVDLAGCYYKPCMMKCLQVHGNELVTFWFHLHLLSHRPKWTETSENNRLERYFEMHRTRRKMMLTAGQQEQQQACNCWHQPLILWFLQYLLCHPSNCWLRSEIISF